MMETIIKADPRNKRVIDILRVPDSAAGRGFGFRGAIDFQAREISQAPADSIELKSSLRPELETIEGFETTFVLKRS